MCAVVCVYKKAACIRHVWKMKFTKNTGFCNGGGGGWRVGETRVLNAGRRASSEVHADALATRSSRQRDALSQLDTVASRPNRMVSIKALPLLLFVAPSSALEVLNGLQVYIPALDCSDDAPSLPHTVLCTHTQIRPRTIEVRKSLAVTVYEL